MTKSEQRIRESLLQGHNIIAEGDNMAVLATVPSSCARLIYIDPPFNTGRTQKRRLSTCRQADLGEQGTQGFGGRRYVRSESTGASYKDDFYDYRTFLLPRFDEAKRILTGDGSIFVHVDPRESHYVKIWLDQIFGRDAFMNEIIWAYDFGGRSKKRWPAKHDTIFWYAKNPRNYIFNYHEIDRIPYMAPGLVGEKKAREGKTPTDTWWHTIVPTSGREKTGYPTQKPLGIVRRIIEVHSGPGDFIVDFFAGSGTAGEAAARARRRFLLVDNNPEATAISEKRLHFASPKVIKFGKGSRIKRAANVQNTHGYT